VKTKSKIEKKVNDKKSEQQEQVSQEHSWQLFSPSLAFTSSQSTFSLSPRIKLKGRSKMIDTM